MFFIRKYLAVITVSFLCSCKERSNSTVNDESVQSVKQSIVNDTVKDSITNNPPANYPYGIPIDSLYSLEFLEKKKSRKEKITKICDKERFVIHFYKLVDLENATSPVLDILLILKSENIIYKAIIASGDTSDATLIKIYNNHCFLGIKYYESLVGYFEYYVYDLMDNTVWKTRKLDELEVLAKDAFNMVTKEYSIKGKSTPLKLEIAEKF